MNNNKNKRRVNILDTTKGIQQSSQRKTKTNLTYHCPLKQNKEINNNLKERALYQTLKDENIDYIITLFCLNNKDTSHTDTNPKKSKKANDRIVSFKQSFKLQNSSYSNSKHKKTLISDYKNQSASISRSEIQKRLIIIGMKSTNNKTNDKKTSKTTHEHERKAKRASSQRMKQSPMKTKNNNISSKRHTKRSSSSHNRTEKYDITKGDCHIVDYYCRRNKNKHNSNCSSSFSINNIKSLHNQKRQTEKKNNHKEIINVTQKEKEIPIAEINLFRDND